MNADLGIRLNADQTRELLSGLIALATRLEPEKVQQRPYQRAFEAIDDALLVTIEYQLAVKERRRPRSTKEDLARKWQKAGRAVGTIDGRRRGEAATEQ